MVVQALVDGVLLLSDSMLVVGAAWTCCIGCSCGRLDLYIAVRSIVRMLSSMVSGVQLRRTHLSQASH